MSLLSVIRAVCESWEAIPKTDGDLGTKETKEDERSPWLPRPAELAHWPVEWRRRWGERANALQDQGIPWPCHERRAFDEIRAEMEATRP